MSSFVPVMRVSLVRDGSVKTPSRIGDRPDAIARIVREFIGASADREHFVVVMLNASNKVLGINLVSMGTLTASLVHPRECFKAAILAGAASLVVAHNHPSGDVRPSREDKETTRRLVAAGRLLGIPVLDHVVIGEGDTFTSFRETGIMPEGDL
jgi:DNA repair protein RadC